MRRALTHELEHVRRRDWVTFCLARTICAVYWFHPLVWIANRQLCVNAERACDDAVERVVRVRARDVSRAYADLHDVEARLVEPAYDLAAEQASRLEPRSATVVMMTSVVDLAAAELLREALLGLARRHRVLLVNLEDPELALLARQAPATVEESFAKASAVEILLANRRLARELRKAGVYAATTGADRLAWQALESYLGVRGARTALTPLAS